MYEIGYRGSIVSFEPVGVAHAGLVQNQRKMHALGLQNPARRYLDATHEWIVAERTALGASCQEAVPINVSENLVGSSLLAMRPECVDHDASIRYARVEKVRMATLDSLWGFHVARFKAPFLKMDVQGYEMEVLKGAIQSLDKVVGLQFECSLFELYVGETLWRDLIEFLQARDFVIMDILPGWRDKDTDQLLQVDVVMVRRGAAEGLLGRPGAAEGCLVHPGPP